MKSLMAGIIGLGLTVWPFALPLLGMRKASYHLVNFSLISLVMGLIVAICGTMIADEEKTSQSRFLGKMLCFVVFLIDAVIVVLAFVIIPKFISQFGVN